ncbi:MAG: OmpA family protein, partial [Polyangiales bacterium]
NLGARVREAQALANLELDHELTWGAGIGVNLFDRFLILTEVFGATSLQDFGQRELSPIEGLFGFKGVTKLGWAVGAAGGVGFSRGYGTPDARALLTVGYAAPVEEPKKAEPLAKAVPTNDDLDGDGIPNDADKCPKEPEDKDGFEDEDGCPDPDNDGDGILDGDDKCPMEPEDKDGFEDEDGCPDPDNDQDSVLDTEDKCPNDAEDKDAFEDEDGCPDPDNDQDSVLDTDDECPLDPGVPEEKGCPKTIRVEEGQIRILERVEFKTGKATLKPSAEAILLEVHKVLDFKKNIRQVRIEGHTDSRGSKKRNMKLSKARARSVKNWLVEHGIAAGRLNAYGCGEERAIDNNKTRKGRQANRRVEFHITDPAPKTPGPGIESCRPAE